MKKLLIAAVALCLALLTPAMAFAETYNYDVYDAEWEDCTESEGRIYGLWSEAEDQTSYTVELYKGTKLVFKRTVSVTRIDLSSAISGKSGGSGTYSFVVVPTKDGKSSESDTLEVTSSMVSKLKKQVAADQKATIVANGAGWVSGPGEIWIYYDQNGNQLKSQWVEDGGYKYYLDKNGRMVTGWQTIGKAWYYFETAKNASRPQGALYVNCVTPDGYTVNEDGAWYDPAKSSGSTGSSGTGSSSSSGTSSGVYTAAKNLSSVSITLKEDKTPGSYTKIQEITSSGGTISNITYQTDPSGWTSNAPGAVVFDLTVGSSSALNGNTKFSCSRASSVTVLSISGQTAQIELHYVPKFVLTQPSGFYMTTDGTLKWVPVQKAASYTVKASYTYEGDDGDTKKKTASITVTEPSFTPSSHGISDEMTINSLSVTAVGSSKKIFVDSSSVSAGDLEALAANPVDGEFKYGSSGMSFRDEVGEQVKGWKQIAGSWYYFKTNGYAAGPGWFQDTDGNWYYFDSSYRMMTGTINDNGTEYVLNDGSNAAFPKGAWVH